MSFKKQFQSLTFRDDFMFGVVMSDLSIAKRVISVILADEIPDIENCELQKSVDNDYDSHSVRYDVYVRTKDGTKVYVVEMQNADNGVLVKRSRYYQSASDMDFLAKGRPYSELPETYVIFICNFDIFGRDKAFYRFENYCIGEGIALGDETYKVFLNINGKTDRKELQSLMSYISGNTPDDELTEKIQDKVDAAKHDGKLYSSFIKEYQNSLSIKEEGRKEGRREGEKKGKLEMIKSLLGIGRSIKEIAEFYKTDEAEIRGILAGA